MPLTEKQKENLRRMLGHVGDGQIHPQLKLMFGEAYLNGPDDAVEGVPPEVEQATEGLGRVFNVTGLVDRAIQRAPAISCLDSQRIMIRHLEGYMARTGTMTWEQSWQIERHVLTCIDPRCRRLRDIAILDCFIPPADMRASYGQEIEALKRKIEQDS